MPISPKHHEQEGERERMRKHLTVPQMAADLGVSPDKVRNWCSSGRIVGVINIGDGANRFYRVTRENWEAFKTSRTVAEPVTHRRFRTRPRTNLLGI